MGVAASNRGSKIVRQSADEAVAVATRRAERDAEKASIATLAARLAVAERDLARARRCIAELRRAAEARRNEARAEQSSSAFAIHTLTRIAFPGDRHG